MHETSWEFVKRYKPYPKMPIIQMLHTPYHTLQLPTMILQQSASIIPYENLRQNVEESSDLDLGGIQDISIGRDQSYCGLNPHQISSSKTCRKISIMVSCSFRKPSNKVVHE